MPKRKRDINHIMSAPPPPAPRHEPPPAPPPIAPMAMRGSGELLLISRLRAQLLASEAEVARLRAENARLRHEAFQRAVWATSAASRAEAEAEVAQQLQVVDRQQHEQQQDRQQQDQPQPIAADNDAPVPARGDAIAGVGGSSADAGRRYEPTGNLPASENNGSQSLRLPAAAAASTAGTASSRSIDAASATRLRASSIAGVSALCSMKRPSSAHSIAGDDNNDMDNAMSAVAAAPGILCLIPGCSEPSEGERSSHLCLEHHGQLRSAATTAAAEALASAGADGESTSRGRDKPSESSAEAKKQKKGVLPAQTKKSHRGKAQARADDVSTGADASSNTADVMIAGGTVNLEGEKLTRSQRRLLESMMREDSNTTSKSTVGADGVSSPNEETKRKPRKKSSSSKPKTDRAGNDNPAAEPTRSTKRRIIKPNRPGIGETKEGRGSDYARIFIRQTLLETLRKVGTAVDPYGFFSSPVDPDADDCPDYYDVVDRETEAMDLGTIESMIKNGTVSTVDEMRAMLMRIVFSCRKYNRDEDDEVREEGENILPLSEPLLGRARKAIEQQMKKSGFVEIDKGTVNDTNSSLSSPRANKRQRTEAGGGPTSSTCASTSRKHSGGKVTATSQQTGSKERGNQSNANGKQRGARTGDSKEASGPTQVFDRPASDVGWGWRIIGIQRCRGRYPDHIDKYWISPKAKKRLRSRKEISRFLTALDKTEGSEEEAFRMIQRKY